MVPLYGQTPTAAKRNRQYRQFISVRWHSCPNKTLCECRQTKKSLHVSRKVWFCFSWRVAKGINRRKGCGGKKKHLNQTNSFSLKSWQPWETGLVRHRFKCTLQVTGLPAWRYTLGSPAHPSQKHTHRSNAQPPNQHTKSEKLKWKTEEKPEEPRRKWDVSKMKVTGIGWKWKYVVMQPAHKQFGSMSGEFKGNSDKSGAE